MYISSSTFRQPNAIHAMSYLNSSHSLVCAAQSPFFVPHPALRKAYLLHKDVSRVYVPSLVPALTHLPQPFSLFSPALVFKIPRFQSLQLLGNLFAVIRNLVRLAGLGPEIRDGEFAVEVRAEVVHDADREEDIHPKLQHDIVSDILLAMAGGKHRSCASGNWEMQGEFAQRKQQPRGECTLKTSRLGPAIFCGMRRSV
ncbi:hypothetical protein ACJQWK_01858 [Exserohilum turcicum]